MLDKMLDTDKIIKSMYKAPNYFLLEQAIRHVYNDVSKLAKANQYEEYNLCFAKPPIPDGEHADEMKDSSVQASMYWFQNHLYPLSLFKIQIDMTLSYILHRVKDIEEIKGETKSMVGTMRRVISLTIYDDKSGLEIVKRLERVLKRYILLEMTQGGVESVLSKYRNEFITGYGIFGALMLSATPVAVAFWSLGQSGWLYLPVAIFTCGLIWNLNVVYRRFRDVNTIKHMLS